MVKLLRRWYPIVILCGVAALIIWMVVSYSAFFAERIYEHSTSHLVEVYSQVNNSFKAFIDKNRSVLGGLNSHIYGGHIHDGLSTDSEVYAFVKSQQEYWSFTEFYFVDKDGSCITIDGSREHMEFSEASEEFLNGGAMIMEGENLSDGQAITLFVLPSELGQYMGFDYEAVAVSYTNEDIVNTFNVDAFSGESKCFVVNPDGVVLLSTQSGGSVFKNYFSYLKAASDLDEEALQAIHTDWVNGVPGLVRCQIGEISYYISYQPTGYQGYMILGLVPESVANSSLLHIQNGTLDILVKIFLLLCAVIVFYLIHRSRKKIQKSVMELRYRDLMFDTLSNSVEDIFVMLDIENKRVDYVSPNVDRLLGVSSQDTIRDITVLEKTAVGEQGKIKKEMFSEIPVQGSTSWDREHIHHRTGERRWYHETVYRKSIKGTEKFIIVMSDRTQERKLNQTLTDALEAAKNANEAKSNFLSNMSHDIRTPMNAVIGLTVLLNKDYDKPEKVKEYTKKISASSHHLLGLINDVLDMSKIESGKTSLNIDKFSLPEMIEEINTIMLPQAKAKAQVFEIHVQGNPEEWILGDKLRLNQILINLLSNSVKYTPECGRISFTVEKLPSSTAQLISLRFVVSDNGIGMSEDFLKTVFDPFSREISSVTNKVQGTGLGMAITKNLVSLMGGVISVSSKLGEGSTFTADLSFALPEQEEDDLLWLNSKISRILVADDEEDVCLNIAELFTDSKIQVDYVTNGADAVNKAVSAKERGEDYDVILLDWKMPEQDGVETARRIRERTNRDIPILVLTSYDWGDIENEARSAGVNAFMSKPFFISTFKRALSALFLEEAQSEESTEKNNVLEGLLFLLVEDIELNAEILSEMLDIEGASCEFAVNGQEAVDMFNRSEAGHYDMILMDVQMPVMNGYEATRQIRAGNHPEAKTVPIVAMTANAFAEDVQNALDAGMNGHLSKPVDMSAMKTLIGKVLSEKNAEKQ